YGRRSGASLAHRGSGQGRRGAGLCGPAGRSRVVRAGGRQHLHVRRRVPGALDPQSGPLRHPRGGAGGRSAQRPAVVSLSRRQRLRALRRPDRHHGAGAQRRQWDPDVARFGDPRGGGFPRGESRRPRPRGGVGGSGGGRLPTRVWIRPRRDRTPPANLRGRPQRRTATFRRAESRLPPPGECAPLSGTMSSDTSLIRPARPEDAEAIARVHVYGWQEAYAGLLPDDFLAGLGRTLDRRRDFWEGLARSLSRRDAFFVAEVGGEIVGFAHGGHSRDHPDENVGEVTAIYLRQAHWGRGIGRRL